MTLQIAAFAVLVAAFALATVRPVHMGALTLAVALGVGTTLAGLSISEILSGFPVDIMLLLLGVTYLFGIARSNGTLDWIVQGAIQRTGARDALLPWVFFALTAGISSLGSPLAGVVLAPLALGIAKQRGRDPIPLGLAVLTGGSAGGFAPTSLFGIITVGVAERSGIEINALAFFGFVVVVNLVLLAAATRLFRRHGAPTEPGEPVDHGGAVSVSAPGQDHLRGGATTGLLAPEKAPILNRLNAFQRVTVVALVSLIVGVVALSVAGVNVNVGALALGLGVTVSVLFSDQTRSAAKDVDWSTILLVGGIITYVGVLQEMGAVDLISDGAAHIQAPLIAAFALCLTGAFVSAFASTTGILGVLIPLALPLIAQGQIPAAGLICALAVSSSLVDSTPFSTAGAAVVASADESDRPRMTKNLMRWGMSMIVIGPLITCAILVVPGYF
ncbi:SLC13 family permease [Rhodococcus sp. NPDC057135]|uniref:SLC13 family permease n=1 Tax=Rhodococcus sp. NPDC057135 TaxID=3346028 RepID=UPI003628A23B